MQDRNHNDLKARLLSSVAGALLIMPALGAYSTASAQDQDAMAEDEDVEMIVVTGSRIARSSLTAPQPLAVIGNQAIQVSGLDNLAEVFNELPLAGVPGLSSTNSAFTVNSSGLNIINLRNLGSARTLVLLDGRRAVSGQPGINAVDLNTVPVDFIERVEIVTGGASALYGSDAVAGVINIIFKDDFEGVRFRAQGSITTEGGGDEFSLSATAGGNFDDGRGNATVNVSYQQDFGLLSRQRNDQLLAGVDLFADDETFSPSSFPEAGRFVVNNDVGTATVNTLPDGSGMDILLPGAGIGWYGIDNTGTPVAFFDAPCNNDARDFENLNTGVNRCALGFNRSYYRTISTPTERLLVASKVHYDISDSVTFFADAQFADVGTFSGIEPFPFASSNIFPATFGGVPLDNPFIPDDILDAINAGNAAATVWNNAVPDWNAAADILNNDGDPTNDVALRGLIPLQTSIGFARRTTELRQRSSANERQTLRTSVGLRGELENGWLWDTSFTYGQTQQTRFGTGQINVQNFRNALDVEPDGIGGYQCADPDARAFGCVPINIFGQGSISPEAAAYVQADASFRAVIQQQVFAANITGDVFDLPAGSVSLATGIEHRRESSDSIPDALAQRGLNASNAIPRTTGKFDVSEWYLEGDIPLLSGSEFAEYAGVGGAVRIADYSTVGTVISWNLRGEWQPISDVRFRVNYGQSVRAPNIAELFTAPSQTFPPGLTDPCAGVTAADAGTTLGANCLAEGGIAAQVNAAGSFAVGFQQLQGISGFNRGNPDLSEEKADTFTASAILTPSFVPGLSITVDYYDIKIDDAISGIPRQSIIDGCYNLTSPARDELCSFITRWPAGTPTPFPGQGQIRFVDLAQLNVGSLQAEGIDVEANYSTELDSIVSGLNGQLDFNFVYSHILTLFQQTFLPDGTSVDDDFRGLINAGTASPKHRWNAQLTYSNGPLQVAYSVRFIGAANLFEGPEDPDDPFDNLDRETYHDIQARYRFGNNEQFEFYAGINNVFNNFAKLIPPGYGSVTGCNSFCATYDAFGRTVQAGLTITY